MRHTAHNAGFSLMEVNMAVFVMAVGILGMVALFPLGLREGVQARADLKQAMFADHALNQIVAILSQTNMTWSVWETLTKDSKTNWKFEGNIDQFQKKLVSISGLKPERLSGGSFDLEDTLAENWTLGVDGKKALNKTHFLITCALPDGTPSARILGITVRVTDIDDPYPSDTRKLNVWKTRYPPYYAEVLFNGIP